MADSIGRRTSQPSRVGDLLGEFLDRSGVGEELARASAVQEWAECVGPEIAQVTWARSVDCGKLIVEVRSSAWMMELNLLKGEILQRLNRDRGDVPIEKLVFVLAPSTQRPG